MKSHRSGPRLLVTHREQALHLERAKVHVEGDRVVYRTADDDLVRRFNIPHANLSILFLGQGTSITQEAARLLAEESVYVAFTGTGGTPLHMGSLTSYQATAHFRRLLPVYLDAGLSLSAARSVMSDRIAMMRATGMDALEDLCGIRNMKPAEKACSAFEKGIADASSMPELLGFEGDYSRSVYRTIAAGCGLAGKSEFRRTPGEPDASDHPSVRLINGLIDHGNYLAYGVAGAALWALGIPPHLSIFHGKTRAGGLVFDIADSFKDALILPIAFAVGAGRIKGDPEQVFRAKVIDALERKEILKRSIATFERMIAQAGERAP
ncbi:type I-F CRISPR-associated endonuclease Cas1f [Defluviimonas salinarum]|uniref:CRISPR-associated endonuclease Cas1 n=1 Tax=Defluviimonas salinarum TaxID=2992147 RepID=A0ABT3J9K7_9RHOB|nr:type I-F CRISPR-associated endonuclease Cas1f [Defluviimonas salinarum]MCW3784382.1 type I-F CRISPR-associated endonuclease Cas1f [Defluviimonas salinarum]